MSRSVLGDAFAHHVWATLRLVDACIRVAGPSGGLPLHAVGRSRHPNSRRPTRHISMRSRTALGANTRT